MKVIWGSLKCIILRSGLGIISAVATLGFVSCSDDSVTGFRNQKPGTPVALWPLDGSVDQNTDMVLTWQCADPDGDSLRYDLFLGISTEPPKVDSNLVIPIYIPAVVKFNTSYYWKVIAYDEHQDSVTGPVWTFTTRREPGIYQVGACSLDVGITITYVLELYEDYALVAGSNSPVLFVDVSDPANPQPAYELSAPGHVCDIEIKDNLAFLAESDFGLQIVDLSNPLAPVTVGNYETEEGFYSVDVQNQYAFLSGPGIYVIDINNSSNPTLMDSLLLYQSNHIAVEGNYIYAVHYGWEVAYLDSYELRNDTTLIFHHSMNLNSVASAVEVDGQNLIVALWSGLVKIFDLSLYPNEISRYASDYGFNDIFVEGDVIYAADWGGGIKIINIRDPLNPSSMAEYDLVASAMNVREANGMIYVVDTDSRFTILEYLP